MGKWLIFALISLLSSGAMALDCSQYNFSKSLCSARLKSLQDYFGPFYREGNTFRTVGCRPLNGRGEKDENCNSDKCEAISFVNVCGLKTFTKELLPVMSEGGESEVVMMMLQKYPKIMENIDPSDSFWKDYYAEKSIFFSDVPHLKIKLTLLEKGFTPDVPTYKAVLEKSIGRREDSGLTKMFESSSFKKDLVQSRNDVQWINDYKTNVNKNLETKTMIVSQEDFNRISHNYLNSSANEKDLLNKKVELTYLSTELKVSPECYDKSSMADVISQKKMSPEVELYISSQISCHDMKGKDELIDLMGSLQQNGMLTRDLFEKIYSRLNKEDPFTEKEILILTASVAQFDKETALKLSLLDFEAIHNFALNLNTQECPQDSKAYKILINLHQKIITEQTEEFLQKLSDPKTSYEELERLMKTQNLNYAHNPKNGKAYYHILAQMPADRFTEEQWKDLVKNGQKPTWEVAFKQIGGINERGDQSAFADVIRSQNVTLFKLFVEIKKKRPGFRYADEKKSALAINNKSGGSSEIKKILKDDSYFDF
jgi:hypothetical protein